MRCLLGRSSPLVLQSIEQLPAQRFFCSPAVGGRRSVACPGWLVPLSLLDFGSFSNLVHCGLVTLYLLIGFPSWSAWLFVILRGGVFIFALRGTTWSLDLRSNRKTVFEHSITFYLMVNRGANTKSDGLPGSTGDSSSTKETVTVNSSCDDGTSDNK